MDAFCVAALLIIDLCLKYEQLRVNGTLRKKEPGEIFSFYLSSPYEGGNGERCSCPLQGSQEESYPKNMSWVSLEIREA